MELKMQPYSLPDAPSFNYEELKTALIEKTKMYETIVYSEDQIKFAKEDRAGLNRLKKALNDERIRQEKEYMQPFTTFKAQINEIIGIIDKPVAAIDKQIKSFEEQQKAEKYQKIEAYWHEVLAADKVPAGICFKHLFCEKWLNASVSMKTIQEAINEKIEQVDKDLSVIRSLPAYAFEAEQVYLSSLDLAKAVSEAHRLEETAKRKAAYEAEQASKRIAEAAQKMADAVDGAIQKSRTVEPVKIPDELPAEPKREWIAFQAYLTPDEARALGQYMKSNGIKYKAV